MPDRRAELVKLTHDFVDAFNRQSIDDVVAFFAEDAVYEDSRGGSHKGPAAIRKAFEPLVCGGRGTIRFDDEDFFAEPESDKVMASWTLNMEVDGRPVRLRGLDLLHFRGGKLVRKMAYCKAATPQLDDGKR
jgi:ketosteroid isomerase-like protein